MNEKPRYRCEVVQLPSGRWKYWILHRCAEVRATELHVSRLRYGKHRTQMTDFHSSLTCINLASPAAVASGGVQPIPIKAEGSATSEPDSRS